MYLGAMPRTRTSYTVDVYGQGFAWRPYVQVISPDGHRAMYGRWCATKAGAGRVAARMIEALILEDS
jgi:hypothetical protein